MLPPNTPTPRRYPVCNHLFSYVNSNCRYYYLFIYILFAAEIELCPEAGGIIAAFENKYEFAKQLISLGIQHPIKIRYVFHPTIIYAFVFMVVTYTNPYYFTAGGTEQASC